MKESILNKLSIAIATLMASSAAFASTDIDSRVTQLENQMQQVRTETAIGTYGAKTASARPDAQEQRFSITTDVLYWHAKVGGTDFAYSDDNPIGTFPTKGRTENVNFNWDWGLRLGVGYDFNHDDWDGRLHYAFFNTNGSDSLGSGLNSTVIPTKADPSIVQSSTSPDSSFRFCASAKSEFKLEYKAVDLDIGRAYFVSKKLSFRPSWGLKTAWIDQKQTTRYTGGTAVGEGQTLGLGNNSVHVKDVCDFWGLGPKAGIDSRWSLGCGLSLFGNLAGSLLYGHFEVDHKQRYTAIEANHIDMTTSRHGFSPAMQMQLGLRYDTEILNNTQHIGIGLGFEANYWWRQNQSLTSAQDVSLHGVTLDASWAF